MVLNLVRHLPARFEPIVCCIHEAGPIGEEIRRTGVPLRVLGLNPGLRRPGHVAGIARALREIQPDIVHTFLLTASLYGRFAAILAGVPIIVGTEVNIYEHKRASSCVRRAAADARDRSRGGVRRIGARVLRPAGACRPGQGRRDLQRGRLVAAADHDLAGSDARLARRARRRARSPASSRVSPSRRRIAICSRRWRPRRDSRRCICWSSAMATCATSSAPRSNASGCLVACISLAHAATWATCWPRSISS